MSGRAALGRGLRLRLTAWYGAVMLLALSGLGGAVYGVVRQQLLRHHDPSLQRTASAVQEILARHEDCARLTPEQLGDLDAIGRLVLLHDMEGRGELFYRSPDTAAFPIPFDLRTDPALLQRPAWFETHRTEAGLVRVLSQPYQSHAGRPGLIRVMDPLGDVEEPLGGLRDALLLLAPVALLIACAGGYWLAGRALAPVEAAYEGMRRFTADASHELRTPLAAIRGTVDVALSRPRGADELSLALGGVGEEVERMSGIVEDLLLLARADAGRKEMARLPLDLAALTASSCETLRPVAEAGGVALATSASPARVMVRGDERWLRQLLVNVISNALRFGAMPAAAGSPGARSPRVDVSIGTEGGSAVLVVADRGPGVPEADLPRLFERFYQVDTARARDARGAGAGLGLSIARWIAQEHGGTITAANRPEGGLAVTIRLPLAPGA